MNWASVSSRIKQTGTSCLIITAISLFVVPVFVIFKVEPAILILVIVSLVSFVVAGIMELLAWILEAGLTEK
jgi:hypothetical protein